jgi:class 3 adenylate cyclase
MTGGDPPTAPVTFVFADIAGFTALTEAHGDQDAAALVADFCRAVRAELPASGGSEVKTVGDAVMLAIPDPAEAILLGLRITHELMWRTTSPATRFAAWRLIRSARLGASPTRTRPTSSARSPALPSSPAGPSDSRGRGRAARGRRELREGLRRRVD